MTTKQIKQFESHVLEIQMSCTFLLNDILALEESLEDAGYSIKSVEGYTKILKIKKLCAEFGVTITEAK